MSDEVSPLTVFKGSRKCSFDAGLRMKIRGEEEMLRHGWGTGLALSIWMFAFHILIVTCARGNRLLIVALRQFLRSPSPRAKSQSFPPSFLVIPQKHTGRILSPALAL